MTVTRSFVRRKRVPSIYANAETWEAVLCRPPDWHREQLATAEGCDALTHVTIPDDYNVTVECQEAVAPERYQRMTVMLVVGDVPMGSMTIYPGGTFPGPWYMRVPARAAFNVIVEFYMSTADSETRAKEIVHPSYIRLRITCAPVVHV